jgi:hypothetical protein
MRWEIESQEQDRVARRNYAESFGLYSAFRRVLYDDAWVVTGIDSAKTTERRKIDKALFREPIADGLDVIVGTLRVRADGQERMIEHLQIEQKSLPLPAKRRNGRRSSLFEADVPRIKAILDRLEAGSKKTLWKECEEEAKSAGGDCEFESKVSRLYTRTRDPEFKKRLGSKYQKLFERHFEID